MKLNYKQYSTEGEPLLVLHGLFGSYGNWGWQARQLASDFAVYGLDLRNHGGSPHSDDMDYPCMARDVLEFMDDHGIARCHLLGHSMGGKTAMQVALAAPERVDRLVVADIAPVQYEGQHDRILAGLKAIDTARKLVKAARDGAMLNGHIPVDIPRELRLAVANRLRKSAPDVAQRLNDT